MPASSKTQQKAAGAALSAKRSDTNVSGLQVADKENYEIMSADELEDDASTDRQHLSSKVGGDD